MFSPLPRVLILGAGGHGKVVADLVREVAQLEGFAEQDEALLGTECAGAKIVMSQQEALASLARPEPQIYGVVAVGHNPTRLSLALALGPGLASALVHPSAVVSPSASLAPGTVVMPQVVVNAQAQVGLGAILNTGCIVEHECSLGQGVHVSPGAVLCGQVTLGEGAWIGAGAVVIPGVHVGAGAVVGAGATVVRNVAAGVTVVGSPARVIHPR